MKYTNNHNLPEYMVKWLMHDDYDYVSGTISATTLLKPSRAYVLSHRHQGELSVDAADLLAIRYGSALHESFENVLLGQIQETRYFADINGFRISGKPDMVIDNQLHDLKSTSVWSYIYNSKDDDFIKQISIYRLLLHKNGIEVLDTGIIDFLFTDWSKSKAAQDASYPQLRYSQKELKLLSIEDTEIFITERLETFENAFESLPGCTAEELWQSETTYALKKDGRKSAIKVYSDLTEANEAAKEDDKLYVETRPGTVKRCSYCVAAPFCDQCKRLKEHGLINE